MIEPTKRLVLVRGTADVPLSPLGAPSTELPLAGRTDDDLMLLARGGMDAAFDVLVRRHQHRVLSVAARLVGQSTLARDVAQNSFLEIYRALARYQPRGKFVPYLNRVVVNQCRMAHRSARVERNAMETVAHVPAEPSPAGEAEILARERQREVESALSNLSEKLKSVVVLRYTGGLAYDEIAEALAIPVGTVKRRLFDAMEKLRSFMEDE